MSKSRKIAFLLMSVLILVVGLVGFQRQAAVCGLPPGQVLPEQSFPGRFGGIPVADEGELAFLVEGFQAGEPVILEPASNSTPVQVIPVLAYDTAYLGVALGSGILFWVMGTFIFLPRFDSPAVRQFFWITMLYGLGVLIGGVFFQRVLAPVGLLLSLVQVTSLAFLPVIFVHLSLIFPVRRPLLGRQPGVPWPLYLLAVVLVVWQGIAFVRYFANPGASTVGGMDLAQNAADLVMVLEVGLGLALLIRQGRSLGPCRERQQVRWLLVGFILGATPYVFLRTVPQLLGLTAPFPAYCDRLFEPAIPLAFVFAIVRYRFLDIDIILRRGILYGILAAILVVLVSVPVVVLGFGWSDRTPLAVKVLPIVGGLVAGLLFQPLRNILGRWIDRTFFKIEHRLDSMLRQLAMDLTKALDQDEIAGLLHSWVIKALDPGAVLVEFASGEAAAGVGQVWAAPRSTTNPDIEVEDFPSDQTARGIVLVLPLVIDRLQEGAVYVGAKNSGHRFVRTDLMFLESAADLASRRLREIRLVQRVVEERLARQQLDELGQLKDDFLSKVAHDLRTPVTSLGWSLRNLLDGLAGGLNLRQQEYMEAMNQAVKHLDGLVAGLLEISRLEKAEVRVVTGPIDLGQVLKEAAGTVRPLAESRQIQLVTSIPGEVPPAVANAEKLAEVLVNLLANAVRYSPDRGEVALAAVGQGQSVILTVRDHGPGFTGISDPFTRFAQGTPSPHSVGGGYGLGLTIAREYLELMGGQITARNHPDGGAEFRIELAAGVLNKRDESHGT